MIDFIIYYSLFISGFSVLLFFGYLAERIADKFYNLSSLEDLDD